tara:strand:- start:3255 stop:3920 length:666 start_codon:yes stop_codon:yes gene_type:complete
MFILSKFESIRFPFPDLKIESVLRSQGYRKKHKVRLVIRKAASESIKKLRDSAAPQGFFLFEKIKTLEVNKLKMNSGVEFNCPVFENMLNGSTHLISFVITLGKEVDEKIRSHAGDADEPLANLFLETAARLCLELVIRQARIKLTEFSRLNEMVLGKRMAPGYSYKEKITNNRVMWDLNEQANLFKMFRGFEIPVKLMESSTMIPRMSRSGIFGLRGIDK